MNQKGLYGAVPMTHFFLQQRLSQGDRAIDATCGSGHDTVLMAQLVGREGKVWAFDIQSQAIEKTRERLEALDLMSRVNLILASNDRMADFVGEPVKSILFNLGYLPTGDREIKTSAMSTLAALQQCEKLLLPEGVIIVVVYTGHEGGNEEWAAVKCWAEALSPHECNVWQSRQLNRSEKAPFLVLVEKVK